MPRAPFRLVALAATVTLAACQGPTVPSPLVGQTRYTCCNMHYEHPEISDANYQVGTLIPMGTRVQILKVGNDSITFQPAGGSPMSLEVRYGKGTSIDEYLARWFPTTDPHTALDKVPVKRRKLIEQGSVESGMTRQEVLMALGYPPSHRTPSLTQNDWHFWQNRWHQYVVFFDGDKVDRVQQ